MLYKTGGSYVNRPFFFRFGQDVRESIFSQINQLSRNVFCFFSSRKENVPLSFLSRRKNVLLLFFLEEKKQKKIKFGRVASLFFCRFRQRGIQNGRFVCEPPGFVVGSLCGRKAALRPSPSAAESFVSFLQEKKTYPFQEKKTYPFQEKKSFSFKKRRSPAWASSC